MADLPTGTVTFLFTDSRWGRAPGPGGGLFLGFVRAKDAVAAACALQRAPLLGEGPLA